MNWMGVSLTRLSWKTLLLGAAAGLVSAALHDAVGWLLLAADAPPRSEALAWAAMGLGLGASLAMVQFVIMGLWGRAIEAGVAGGALGALAAGLGYYLMNWLPGMPEAAEPGRSWSDFSPLWLLLPLIFGLVGAAGGVGAGHGVTGSRKRVFRGGAGLLAGGLTGIPLTALLTGFPGYTWLFQLSLALWSAQVAWVILWSEKRFPRCWLRVLNGPLEDLYFPLNGSRVTLGKLESNDVPLASYKEVFPIHCHLDWKDDHYELVDDEEGGAVSVNYRPIREQPLQTGDLLKIGSALLQYGEQK